MKINEFLEDFEDDDFPSELGKVLTFDCLMPMFTKTQLKQMDKAGIIKVNWEQEYFQLTLKATKLKRDKNEE